jgi:hypothetical protein
MQSDSSVLAPVCASSHFKVLHTSDIQVQWLSFSGSLIVGIPHISANNSLRYNKPMHCNQGLGKACALLLQGTVVDIAPRRFL